MASFSQPLAGLTYAQSEARRAVRQLAVATVAVDPKAEPGRARRLAQLTLEAYDLATETDPDFYLVPSTLKAVEDVLARAEAEIKAHADQWARITGEIV
jgi:hypothetical protein